MVHPSDQMVKVAVVGAHLTGQPLNYQLTDEGAILIQTTRTKSIYKLYAIEGVIPKPGLVRQGEGRGWAIEVEVWEISVTGFGRFVVQIPPPLGMGNVILEDDRVVKGFICEPYAIINGTEISHFGSWRTYLSNQGQ